MIKRERLVMFGVFGVAASVVLYLVGSSVYGAINSKRNELQRVKDQLTSAEAVVRESKMARVRLAKYEQRALPMDADKQNVNQAKTLYMDWLIALMEKHQFESKSQLRPVVDRSQKNFRTISYAITAQGNLVQVTRFLHDFYAVDYLHRISRLNLRPVDKARNDKTKVLEMQMTVEVLAMPNAPYIAELPSAKDRPSNRLTHGEVDNYLTAIAGRNVFEDPHNPPTLSIDSKSKYTLGSAVSFKASGKDPEGTPTTFSLDEHKLAGAKMDPKSGSFTWTPKEPGSYEVTVRVTDGGVPAKSVTKLVKFVVEKVPEIARTNTQPLPPAYDDSKSTHLSAVISIDGVAQAWFKIRTQNRMLYVKVGDPLEVGEMKAKVVAIGRDNVELELDNGKRWLVTRGSTLREGYELPPAAQATSLEAASTGQ